MNFPLYNSFEKKKSYQYSNNKNRKEINNDNRSLDKNNLFIRKNVSEDKYNNYKSNYNINNFGNNNYNLNNNNLLNKKSEENYKLNLYTPLYNLNQNDKRPNDNVIIFGNNNNKYSSIDNKSIKIDINRRTNLDNNNINNPITLKELCNQNIDEKINLNLPKNLIEKKNENNFRFNEEIDEWDF